MWFMWIGVAPATDWNIRPGQSVADLLDQVEDGDRVVFEAGSFPDDVLLSNLDEVEFIGAGSDPATGTVFDGGADSSVWSLDDCRDITIRGLVIDGQGVRRGVAATGGSSVLLDDVRIRRGQGQPRGGGLLVDSESNAVVRDSRFEDNAALGRGGALWSLGDIEVRDSTFLRNQVQLEAGEDYTGVGAGLYCENACTVTDSWFEAGIAARGAGIHVLAADGVVLRNTFCNNDANLLDADGAALAFHQASGTVSNNVFLYNHTAEHGPGIYVLESAVTAINNTFLGNLANGRGGAIYQVDATSTVILTNNLFHSNTADLDPWAAVDIAAGNVTGGFNLFWDNARIHAAPSLPDDSILGDPALADVTGDCSADVRPDPAGPAHDAGDPAIVDLDGSRSDIGATGGPHADPDLCPWGDCVEVSDTGTVDLPFDRVLPRGWYCAATRGAPSGLPWVAALWFVGRRRRDQMQPDQRPVSNHQ